MEEAFEKMLNEKTCGYPWIANKYAQFKSAYFDSIEQDLRLKRNPAYKAAEAVKEVKIKYKESESKRFIAEGILEYYESLFPWLPDLREAPDYAIERNHLIESDNITDLAKHYLSESEWRNYTSTDKFQHALDRYWKNQKNKWEIGRLYERYIGYEYENNGWTVEYTGAIKGVEDMGRDLIATKNNEIRIIQCKYWSNNKTIHEKHVFQLFGTCIQYDIENSEAFTQTQSSLPLLDLNKPKIVGIFVTSCELSPLARKCATHLGIIVEEHKRLERYPCIKCVVRDKEPIYHLPFDQQYDKIKMRMDKGDFYCTNVKEAEEAGFRRAYRWSGN